MTRDLPKKVVDKMMQNDAFSKWLGIEVKVIKAGYCELEMKVREEMINGFGLAHGGISYSLADSALAFASNSHGVHALSIETSISHMKPCTAGNTLLAKAEEIESSNKIGRYMVSITNEKKELIASFKGTVYKTGKSWF